MTARDLITATLRSIRVLGVGDTLENEDANDAFDRLNDWIDGLALERLTMYYVGRTVKPLLAGKVTYTIGRGGEIDIVRPTTIESAALIQDTSVAGGPVLPPPGAPIVLMFGLPGTVRYSYKVTATNEWGETDGSAEGTTLVGSDPLSVSNYVSVTWLPVPGALGYKVYRTYGVHPQKELIGEVATGSLLAINDTGIAGVPVADAPTINTTGSLVGATTYEQPVEVMTDQRWQGIRQKGLASPYISGVYFDHNWFPGPNAPPQPPATSPPAIGQTHGLGRIYVWPVPSASNTALVLYTPIALSEFATLDTDYTFAPGYRRFIRTNFAAEIASEYGKQLTGDQLKAAALSKGAIKRGNVRPGQLRCDPAIVWGGDYFDWRTGESR